MDRDEWNRLSPATKLHLFILHQGLTAHLRMRNINLTPRNTLAKSSLGKAKSVLAFISSRTYVIDFCV